MLRTLHIVLVCEKEKLSNIVRKLKGKSAQEYKKFLGVPTEEVFHLWAQKYNISYIDSDEKLRNTIEYIQGNRAKHGLEVNQALQSLIQEMCSFLDS